MARGVRVVKKFFVAGISVAALLGVAACSSSSGSPGAAGLHSVPASVPASVAPDTAAPQPIATATAIIALPAQKACKVGSLSVTVSTNDGAAGTLVNRFIIKNTSTVACTIKGHPFISPYGLMTQDGAKAEANLDITVDPIPSTFNEIGAAGTSHTVQPGGTVVFFLKWSQVPVNDVKCPDADGFDFQPPGGTSSDNSKLIDFKFTPCGGEMQVSNVFSSSVGG